MPIVSGDIDFHGSGGASAATIDLWLGGVQSNTQVTDNVDNNLFEDVTGAEASSGNTDYKGIYVRNAHGSLTLQNAVIWIESNTTSGDTAVRIALDLAGKNATMDTIVDKDTEPSPVPTWSTAANKGAGLTLGDMAFSENFGIWVERVVSAAASAVNGDTFQLKVEGDTSA